MKISRLAPILDKIAPVQMQEEWDNSGFQIIFNDVDVLKILVALEIGEKVIDEAISKDVQLIITHHPLFFHGIKSVDDNVNTGNQIIRLINNKISVYSSHTPFDKVSGGNNDFFGKLLSIEKPMILPGDSTGICRLGQLNKTMNVLEFADLVSKKLNIDKKYFSYCGPKELSVKTVAWCTGSGSDFISLAMDSGCDLFVTGDLKYHTARNARECGFAVMDCGHYATEKIFSENYAGILSDLLDKDSIVDIISSCINLNPYEIL